MKILLHKQLIFFVIEGGKIDIVIFTYNIFINIKINFLLKNYILNYLSKFFNRMTFTLVNFFSMMVYFLGNSFILIL